MSVVCRENDGRGLAALCLLPQSSGKVERARQVLLALGKRLCLLHQLRLAWLMRMRLDDSAKNMLAVTGAVQASMV